jgi:4-hydroxy-3-methylbut-2-en-1-yl diphosphate synthase IspG/GcpE
MTVPDAQAAAVLGEVRRSSPIPIVADVHFDYRCALAALSAGADALRINPGNIGSRERVSAVARAAKERGVPIRIGVNGGSLEKGETLVSSALKNLKALEDEGYAFLEATNDMVPQNTVAVSGDDVLKKIYWMLDQFDDHDDVQNVYHNAELPEDEEEE